MKVVITDGGRRKAGYIGKAGDCVCRAIAIASGLPYDKVYDDLSIINERMPRSKRRQRGAVGIRTAARGIYTKSKLFKDYMHSLGFVWTPTMHIGSGCTVHLHDGELPNGRLVVSVSRHFTAVIDGVIHDTHDPQREMHCIDPDTSRELKKGEWINENGICSIQRRCVYGYWSFEP